MLVVYSWCRPKRKLLVDGRNYVEVAYAIYPLVDITNYVNGIRSSNARFDLREIKGGIRVRYPEANENWCYWTVVR